MRALKFRFASFLHAPLWRRWKLVDVEAASMTGLIGQDEDGWGNPTAFVYFD